ncbi:uncharacterized protein JCM6883_003703 [Sporobolomyces salmoneus]|uniref:uncharacterized protein n=1 Tax=Sporobolomyces salmoneus TaxID=183962 RepID=UPI003170E460
MNARPLTFESMFEQKQFGNPSLPTVHVYLCSGGNSGTGRVSIADLGPKIQGRFTGINLKIHQNPGRNDQVKIQYVICCHPLQLGPNIWQILELRRQVGLPCYLVTYGHLMQCWEAQRWIDIPHPEHVWVVPGEVTYPSTYSQSTATYPTRPVSKANPLKSLPTLSTMFNFKASLDSFTKEYNKRKDLNITLLRPPLDWNVGDSESENSDHENSSSDSELEIINSPSGSHVTSTSASRARSNRSRASNSDSRTLSSNQLDLTASSPSPEPPVESAAELLKRALAIKAALLSGVPSDDHAVGGSGGGGGGAVAVGGGVVGGSAGGGGGAVGGSVGGGAVAGGASGSGTRDTGEDVLIMSEKRKGKQRAVSNDPEPMVNMLVDVDGEVVDLGTGYTVDEVARMNDYEKQLALDGLLLDRRQRQQQASTSLPPHQSELDAGKGFDDVYERLESMTNALEDGIIKLEEKKKKQVEDAEVVGMVQEALNEEAEEAKRVARELGEENTILKERLSARENEIEMLEARLRGAIEEDVAKDVMAQGLLDSLMTPPPSPELPRAPLSFRRSYWPHGDATVAPITKPELLRPTPPPSPEERLSDPFVSTRSSPIASLARMFGTTNIYDNFPAPTNHPNRDDSLDAMEEGSADEDEEMGE